MKPNMLGVVSKSSTPLLIELVFICVPSGRPAGFIRLETSYGSMYFVDKTATSVVICGEVLLISYSLGMKT